VLDVVGEVPADLRQELQAKAQATFFHGFVDDMRPYLQSARFALVPEVIGGGFKLKVLDYIFGRVPVATISDAAAGLPLAIQDSMLNATTLEDLTARIVASIDNNTLLNRLHKDAFKAAASAFEWHDRGTALHDAIHDVISRRESGRNKVVTNFRKGVAI
jgi:glycosyltransferase involved in cell wall biosynthesis